MATPPTTTTTTTTTTPTSTTQPDPRFTVFIRLPFPRGDFVDPPQAEWNSFKEQVLWEVLSQPSRENDIDWKSLAETLNVTLPFLLQQAAWLYDRKLAQVRAQLRKVGNHQSVPGSPLPSSFSGGNPLDGQPINRTGSSDSPAPSRLSIRHREELPKTEGSVPATPIRSRVALGTEQKPNVGTQSPRNWLSQQRPPARQSTGRTGSTSRRESRVPSLRFGSPPGGDGSPEMLSSSSSSSTSSDSEAEGGGRPGLTFRRFGKFSIPRLGRNHGENEEQEDDDDDDPAFLPLSDSPEEEGDLRATLRQQPERHDVRSEVSDEPTPMAEQPTAVDTSTSSVSSGMVTSFHAPGRSQTAHQPGLLSPRRAAEMARLSPRQRGFRNGSEGTPSMGSSFSDLDDASVTQSALEEALLSNMRHGTIASRMSTISQALKSRYL
ncbi:hypothetical protein VTO42DRAFT_6047 [Malbranchea cinnamomea]